MNIADADLIARRTVARYRTAIDTKDAVALAAVFAEHATLHRRGETTEGRDAIVDFYSGFFPTVGHMRHFISNTLAEPDGEVIRAASVFTYVQVLDEGVRFGWGDYEDVIRPVGEGEGQVVSKSITVHASQIMSMEVAAALLPPHA